MSITGEIYRIKNAKAAIKEAIINKGVTVSDTAKIDDFPGLINSIVASEDNNEYIWPNFFEMRNRNRYSTQHLFACTTIYESEYQYKELIENLDVSEANRFDGMFMDFNHYDNSSTITPKNAIKELNLTNWDVSNATVFTEMFGECYLDYLDISGWDFTKANGSYLQIFYSTKIKEINMSNCKISNKSHYRLFAQSLELVTINMTGCDTSMTTSMNNMFSSCPKLTTIIGELDTSGLTNGLYPGSSTHPFSNCTSLETLYLKNIYKDIAVTNVSKFSIDLGVTKVKDECLVYIIDQLPNLADKGITNNTAIKLTLPTINTLTEEQKQVALDKGWIVVN